MASLVTVASFRDVLDAEAARTALEAEGVECYLADQQIVGMNWNYSQAVGGVKLRVWDEAETRARQILSEDHSAEAEEHFATPEAETCPQCGSTDLHLVNRSRNAAAVMAFLGIGIPIPLFGRSIKCGSCAHRWKRAAR